MQTRERGSVTVWLALASFVMIVVVGLAVDLTGQVHAQQRARDLAAQAARVGGQQINTPRAIRGLGLETNAAGAVAGTGLTSRQRRRRCRGCVRFRS